MTSTAIKNSLHLLKEIKEQLAQAKNPSYSNDIFEKIDIKDHSFTKTKNIDQKYESLENTRKDQFNLKDLKNLIEEEIENFEFECNGMTERIITLMDQIHNEKNVYDETLDETTTLMDSFKTLSQKFDKVIGDLEEK